jgi:hypothetical protein
LGELTSRLIEDKQPLQLVRVLTPDEEAVEGHEEELGNGVLAWSPGNWLSRTTVGVASSLLRLVALTGSALFVAGGTTNWLQGVGDHFAERSLGWKLFAASSIGHLSGISMVIPGVIVGL